MDIKPFQILEFINSRLSNIENNISRLEEKMDFSLSLQRNHLLRIKHGEDIDDSMILMGRPYNDLSPHKAHKIFQDLNQDFIVVDVTKKDSKITNKLEGSLHIPLEELDQRYLEVHSKTIPILIISEKGLRSIQACEKLVKKGHFNVNNISGGYEFWPGSTSQSLPELEVS